MTSAGRISEEFRRSPVRETLRGHLLHIHAELARAAGALRTGGVFLDLRRRSDPWVRHVTGLSRRSVEAAARRGLARWEGDDLRVLYYDAESERRAEALRLKMAELGRRSRAAEARRRAELADLVATLRREAAAGGTSPGAPRHESSTSPSRSEGLTQQDHSIDAQRALNGRSTSRARGDDLSRSRDLPDPPSDADLRSSLTPSIDGERGASREGGRDPAPPHRGQTDPKRALEALQRAPGGFRRWAGVFVGLKGSQASAWLPEALAAWEREGLEARADEVVDFTKRDAERRRGGHYLPKPDRFLEGPVKVYLRTRPRPAAPPPPAAVGAPGGLPGLTPEQLAELEADRRALGLRRGLS